jgi:tetratricopeptide (TPR) repeat protein/KaiC/GvpD/RAD55 family RecA-like ATPase
MSEQVEALLNEARTEEKKHNWLKSVDCYTRAQSLISSKDIFKSAMILERLGYAFYRLAMQSEDNEKFRERCAKAVGNYEKAGRGFSESDGLTGKPRMLRCRAMVTYLNFWLASKAEDKKVLVVECWKLAKKSLQTLGNADDKAEYVLTYNQLVDIAFFAFFLEWNFRSRKRLLKEAGDFGEHAINWLSESIDVWERARAYAKTMICITLFAYNFLDVSDRDREYEKASACWSRAKELSEEVAVQEILHPFFGPNIIFGVEGTEEALKNFEQALKLVEGTKNRFLIGSALDWLTYHMAWSTRRTEEHDRQLQLSEKAMKYAKRAKEAFLPIGFTSPRDDLAWIDDASQVGCFSSIVINETDLQKKRDMLDQALKSAPDMLRRATDSGYPETVSYAHHIYSFVLTAVSKLEKNKDERKKMLNEALKHRNESLKIVSLTQPFMYWNRGVNHQLLAAVRSELADLTDDPRVKREIIHEAIADSEASLKLRNRDLVFYRTKGSPEALIAQIAEDQLLRGKLLMQSYTFSRENIDLHKALQSYERSLREYQSLRSMSRVAECYWIIAKVYDSVAEHAWSAENFRRASISYEEAEKKFPHLQEFYEGLSTYMLSWSEIEKARHNHRKQNYGEAKKHFEKAAQLHRGLSHWSYLEPNYVAWALVEHGEELSRKDKPDQAVREFKRAAAMFIETEQSIKTRLPSIETTEERTMATNILKGSNLRHQYCLARVDLEQARLLDKEGDHLRSSQKYGVAARSLEKIRAKLEFEHDRKEFEFLIVVSRAWEKMMIAEAEAVPAFYLEAATYFERAGEISPNEKSRFLVQGHSQMCKALQTGLELTGKMDESLYNAAKKFLENAATCYKKAGFLEAKEYAKATELLFNAYWTIGLAKGERDSEKRAQLCLTAERILADSAGSFKRARHFEKQEQVVELRDKVGTLRELTTSFRPLLSASRIASTRNVFSVPTPTYEEPVGLERFESAEIRANINPNKRQLRIGESFVLNIEIINAGKGYALLTKIKGAIPKDFDVAEKPERFQIEDSSLNLQGKKLNPLQTEEVTLSLKPRTPGSFTLEPTILFLGEDGKYKAYQADPIRLRVGDAYSEAAASAGNLVDTGFVALDRSLYGGIAPNSAVIVVSALAGERASLVTSFLKKGLERKQTVFYMTMRGSNLTDLAERHPSDLCLFICNPHADMMVGDLPNVFKLRGIENLNEINIALSTALNRLPTPPDNQRRACIEILSDILLQHEALRTRKWLYSLIPLMKSNGFTVLALIDPEMHLSREVHAVLDVFDGEINVYEKQTANESKRYLRVLRMHDQEYSEKEHALDQR